MPNPSVRVCIGSPSYSEYRSLHNVVSFYIATLSSTTDSFMCPAKTTVASLKFFQEYRCIYAQGPLQLLFSLLGIFFPLIATRFGLLLDAGKTKYHFFFSEPLHEYVVENYNSTHTTFLPFFLS